MDAAAFINYAIDRGSSMGLVELAGLEREVFLVSEAEVLCDLDGIDSFVDRYESSGLREAAAAFRQIGATDIAAGMEAMAASLPTVSEDLWDQVTRLVTARAGYDFESIERYVSAKLTS